MSRATAGTAPEKGSTIGRVFTSDWRPDLHVARLEEAEEAPVDAPLRCGNPDCPDPTSTSRLQRLPQDFTGTCVPGAKHFSPESAVRSVVSRVSQRKRGASGALIPWPFQWSSSWTLTSAHPSSARSTSFGATGAPHLPCTAIGEERPRLFLAKNPRALCQRVGQPARGNMRGE